MPTEHTSTEDATATVLHIALTHLNQKGTYMRMLFIDYSSAFNTIIPSRLVTQLLGLGLNNTLCMWIKDYPKKTVRLGIHLSDPQHWGATGLCSESHAVFTFDCISTYPTNTIIKFADDTTVALPISTTMKHNTGRK